MSSPSIASQSQISTEEVRRIATLARLNPSSVEEERLAGEMSHILDHIEQLKELETSDIEPLHHVLDLVNVLRDDLPRQSLSAEAALKNVPERKEDCILVPKVIKDFDHSRTSNATSTQ